jgi:drug/metabolite transporter (DMT)-like permease
MLLVGGFSLLSALVALGQPLAPLAWDAVTLALLAGQTAVVTLLYLLYFVLQKIAGPVYLSQIGSVGALVGLTLAALLLGEAITPAILLAGLLVGAGIVAVNRGARAAG